MQQELVKLISLTTTQLLILIATVYVTDVYLALRENVIIIFDCISIKPNSVQAGKNFHF